MTESTAAIQERPRQIVHRTHGQPHGPVTRLMSPSDLGQSLKPFVFLDLFDTEGGSFPGVGWHPHSGIATLTYLWEGSEHDKLWRSACPSLKSTPRLGIQSFFGS